MMPDACAFGILGADQGYVLGKNLNPHPAWSELPARTRSPVLIDDELDVPARLDPFDRERAAVARLELPEAARLGRHAVLDASRDGPAHVLDPAWRDGAAG
jgi:hypothetical protein